jgi:glycosyltransferase involved in cell wall biosynthesis
MSTLAAKPRSEIAYSCDGTVCPLRIALVHVADKGGGAERSVLTLHKSLLKQGHDSRMFVGNKLLDEDGVIEIEQNRTIPGLLRITRRLEEKGIQNLYAPWFQRLPELIGDVDVVHLHSLWKNRNSFADLSGIAAIAKRYATVMTLRDGWMLTGHCACPIDCDRWKTGCGQCPDLSRPPAVEKDFTRFNWNRKRKTIQRSDLQVTAVSSWLKGELEQSPIFADKTVHVVHNSVDAAEFQPGNMATARRELGIPLDQFVVMLAGQSIEGFNQGISQHAIAALNDLGDQGIHTMLVGRSAAHVAVTLNSPSTTVPFRETPEEMAQCYQAADLTIVPSEYETFGRVAAESLFCGTPVLAFATGGLSDIVTAEVCGRLVPTGNVGALAAGIAELKSSPQTLNEMRRNCVECARSRFSTDRIAKQYVDIYEGAIAERVQGEVSTSPIRLQAQLTDPAESRVEDSGVATSESPRISCIIPAYNCEQWLPRAVDSLLETGYAQLEIIIIDDGSLDKTLSVARQLQAAHPNIVRAMQHPDGRNRGVSASRNLGILSSSGELLCFLDGDDYVHPNRFTATLSPILQNRTIDGVFGTTEMQFDSMGAEKAWGFEGKLFGLREPVEGTELLRTLLNGRVWATSAILVRRSLLDQTGLFEESFETAEDCHLWWRMAAIGKIASGDLSKPVAVYYRHTHNSFAPGIDRRVAMQESLLSFLKWSKHHDIQLARLDLAKSAVDSYFRRSIVASREAGRSDVALSLIKLAFRNRSAGLVFKSPSIRIGIWAVLKGVLLPK